MRTTKDEYELPLAVAESCEELAKMVGVSKSTAACCISRKYKGWVKVIFQDDEWEEDDGKD